MSIPRPPFHSVTEELLYNIYLKFQDMNSLKESDINTLAKLNAILTDADLMKAEDVNSAIQTIRGNVPSAGNTLEKLFNIILGFDFLKREDIDTLAELNAILSDTDVAKAEDLADALLLTWLKGGNTVEITTPFGTKDNFDLPFITNNTEQARFTRMGQFLIGSPVSLSGLDGYKLQLYSGGPGALGVIGNSIFKEGDFIINLGKEGSSELHSLRINSYVDGLGEGFDFRLGGNNINAAVELSDYQSGGSKSEMLRLMPAHYANTGILIRPNDLYNTTYGYRYILQGTNVLQQNRFVSAYHASLNFPVNDAFPGTNRVRLFAAQASGTNHFIDGFFADVRGTDPNAEVFAYRSLGSRILFDGNGMNFVHPVVTMTTDFSAHVGANALLLNGSYILSAALYIAPMGSERTGVIISPGQNQANGMFISPQQSLGSYNYDGYLMWLQYSTTGNNMLGGTTKPILYIRKHSAKLNGFDHTGAFIRLEENIGSTGSFIEAYKFDTATNLLKLKFSVDRDGVVSMGQVGAFAVAAIEGVARLFFNGSDLIYQTPTGEERVLQYFTT